MTDATQLPPSSDEAGDPKVAKPPADTPISTSLEVFDRLFAAGLVGARVVYAGDARRYITHAFYAGASATFAAVIDSMREQDEGDPDGEKRFAAIEREIDTYFRDLVKRGVIDARRIITPGGRT